MNNETATAFFYTAEDAATAVERAPPPLLVPLTRRHRPDRVWAALCSSCAARMRSTAAATDAVKSSSCRMAPGGLRATLPSELLWKGA